MVALELYEAGLQAGEHDDAPGGDAVARSQSRLQKVLEAG